MVGGLCFFYVHNYCTTIKRPASLPHTFKRCNTMLHNKLTADLDKVRKRYAKKLQARIIKVCDKTGARYLAGMGTWYFETKGGATMSPSYNWSGPDPIKRLMRVLVACDGVDEYFVSGYTESYNPKQATV